jgi:DNA-binding transcriptional LysR family regulator
LAPTTIHNPLDMLVFAKVVELRGFSTAARHLGISRSTASKHVTRLERALRARLLNRTTRKLSLTEAGRSVYAHCARLAREIDATHNSVQPFLSRPQGLLRVSAPIAFGRLHLVRVLPEYLARHSEVAIDLELSDRLVDLVEERFDIAISSSPQIHANLIRRKLAPINWTICAAPDYLKRCGIPKRPDDLRRHNCIFYASQIVPGDNWALRRENENVTVQIGGNFRANNSEAVRDATVQGLGIGLLPTFAIAGEIAAGQLVPLLHDWMPLGTFGNSLIAHFIADRYLMPKIRTLIDFLVEQFGHIPPWDSPLLGGQKPRKRA